MSLRPSDRIYQFYGGDFSSFYPFRVPLGRTMVGNKHNYFLF